jgi:hypothetical protein
MSALKSAGSSLTVSLPTGRWLDAGVPAAELVAVADGCAVEVATGVGVPPAVHPATARLKARAAAREIAVGCFMIDVLPAGCLIAATVARRR